MIGIAQCQHVDIAAEGLGHDEREVDRFGSTVGEMHDPVLALGHARGELLGEMRRHRMIEHRGAVLELADLLLDRSGYGGMRMADRNADIHAEEIEVFLAFFVPQILAFAM